MTVTTTVTQCLAYAVQAHADKRYEDEAAAYQEAIDNSNPALGSANTSTLASYATSRDAAIALSHKAGAF